MYEIFSIVCKKTPLFSKEIDATHYCNDLCRISCRAVSYEISFYKQPLSISNTSDETTTRQVFQDFLKKPISLDTLRLTGVRVNILVKNKELLVYHHHPRYQDVELFSYIGGYIGIWLGISLANVLEVIRNCAVKAKDWFLDLKKLSSKIIKMIRETLASIHVIQI